MPAIGPGFAVLCRWRLHRGPDGVWYSYAQWPDEATRRAAFSQASGDPSASLPMKAAIAESLPEIVLESVVDLLLPLAPNTMSR